MMQEIVELPWRNYFERDFFTKVQVIVQGVPPNVWIQLQNSESQNSKSLFYVCPGKWCNRRHS